MLQYIFLAVLGILALFAIFGGNGGSSNPVAQDSDLAGKKYMILFHSNSCPHCRDAIKFIDNTLKSEFPDVVFKRYETSEPQARALLNEFSARLKFSVRYVPVAVFSNDKFMIGFDNAEGMGQDYRNMLKSL